MACLNIEVEIKANLVFSSHLSNALREMPALKKFSFVAKDKDYNLISNTSCDNILKAVNDLKLTSLRIHVCSLNEKTFSLLKKFIESHKKLLILEIGANKNNFRVNRIIELVHNNLKSLKELVLLDSRN